MKKKKIEQYGNFVAPVKNPTYEELPLVNLTENSDTSKNELTDSLENNIALDNYEIENDVSDTSQNETVSKSNDMESWEEPFYEQYAKKQNNKKKKNKNKNKVTRPIGVKLIFIISLIVVISMGLVTYLVSYFITQDTRISAEETNKTINARTASDCQTRFASYVNSANLLLDITDQSNNSTINAIQNANSFFDRNKDIAAISFLNSNKDYINKRFFLLNNISQEQYKVYLNIVEDDITSAKNGEYKITNATPYFGISLISIAYNIQVGNTTQAVLILFSSENLTTSFSEGSVNLTYIVNDAGKVIVHPDIECVKKVTDISNNTLYKKMFSSKNNSEQITYIDESDNKEYIGAFTKLNFAGCSVLTQVQTQIVLEGVNKTTTQIKWLSLTILCLAIIIIWFFARSLSSPIQVLTEVSKEIQKGNFNTKLFDLLNENRKDEIGVLSSSTKDEREILNTFTKLTNTGVTKAIVLKKIDFEPHLKDITIFFSDIRGFTKISDGFNQEYGDESAKYIINFLNDYMGRMVNCIATTGGTVDKFEGDAIMAAWGVLRDDNLDYEKLDHSSKEYIKKNNEHNIHVKEDAVSAIKTALAMRYSLMEYNQKGEGPLIRIGSGINVGRATVGFMGSEDKMEFTSIGDAVNLASRTESSNKLCGTDILITQDAYNLLKNDFIRCQENNFILSQENEENELIVEKIPVSFEVKGKGKQYFYGVVNMPAFNIEKFFKKNNPSFIVNEECALAIGKNGPKNLDGVRELLGIPKPDFSGVDFEKEENKIQISNS